MAIQILNSGVEQRKPGYTVKTGVSVISGKPVQYDPNDTTGATIMLGDGNSMTMGFALETNVAPTSPSVNYDDYNRGGLVAYTCGMGVEMKIWDDGRGAPYDTTQTYVMNQAVYCGATGLVTNQVNGTIIGYVTKVPTSATDALIIKSVI